MRVEGLLVRVKRYLAHRKRVYGRIEATRPNELWQMDMPKVWWGRSGWGYLVTVVDCFDRSVVGKRLSLRCGTEDALECLEEAIGRRFPEGVKGKGLALRTDNGCQFTSRRFVLALKSLGITPSRTGYNNPEGNAMVERFYRTLKEEEVWLKEYQDIREATLQLYTAL